jgi:hypothetical protein
MTKPLLVILSHSGANETVRRHWRSWLNADCDIMGVGRMDTKCEWPVEPGFKWPSPNDATITRKFWGTIDVGQESYAKGDNHLRRFLDVLKYCVHHTDYTSFCLIEYDVLLFKPLVEPSGHSEWLLTTLAGGGSDGFHATKFFHCPWWINRRQAVKVLVWGECMLKAGLHEQGFLDRWLGLMSDLYSGLQILETGWYSANTIDTPDKVRQARNSIQAGKGGIHGCKTIQQLTDITS